VTTVTAAQVDWTGARLVWLPAVQGWAGKMVQSNGRFFFGHLSHSRSAGATTASAKAGVSKRHIKQHGNWQSDAVRVYI
jgi:hypothetical protein